MADFNDAFKVLLEHEGGYSNDPDDSGGETRYGISHKSYPDLNIKCLTLEMAKKIYKEDYWDKMRLDEINYQIVANKIFDIGVNIGIRRIIKILQAAINTDRFPNKIEIDGVIGNKTIAACNQCHPQVLLSYLKPMIADYYKSLGNKKYLRGWVNRAFS